MSDPQLRCTGVFIPIEILENEDLSYMEIFLLTWIDLLYNEEKKGCFASNSYLAKKVGVKENSIAKSLVNLRKLKLIEDVSFDGRKRVIRSCVGKRVYEQQARKGLEKNPSEGWKKIQPTVGKKSIAPIASPYTLEKTVDKSLYITGKGEKLPPASKEENTASFDPFTYRLRNGEALQLRTARSFAKYSGQEKERLFANVRWYEERMDAGGVPRETHEKFLQWAIKKDMARKESVIWQNETLAKIYKEQYSLHGMKILKTVISLDKQDGSTPESISKDLNPSQFKEILNRYIQSVKNNLYLTRR